MTESPLNPSLVIEAVAESAVVEPVAFEVAELVAFPLFWKVAAGAVLALLRPLALRRSSLTPLLRSRLKIKFVP